MTDETKEAAEDPASERESESHRPLPSVNMPLLAEERRAVRSRQLIFWSLGLGLLAVGVASYTAMPENKDSPSKRGNANQTLASTKTAPDPVPEPEPPPADVPSPAEVVGAANNSSSTTPTMIEASDRTSREFGRSRSFHHAVLALGVDAETAAGIEGALRGILDFRRCQKKDRLVVERTSQGEVVLFEYHSGLTEYFKAQKDANGKFVGDKVKIPVEKTRVRKGGTVRSSLGDALAHADLGRSLVGVFVEAFQRKIHFGRQTRKGDTFRIVVDEERVNGEFLGYGTVHALEYDGQRTGTLRAFWFEPKGGDGDFYDESGHALHGSWLRTPLRFDRISSLFNPKRRHPILKRIVPHNGVDYAASTGTLVHAAAAGTIVHAGPKGANGNLVGIRHDNGYETYYAHLHRIQRGIKPGVKVDQRQVVGAVGSTGRSTGPHLHFGLKRNGRFVDPLKVINGPGKPLPGAEKGRFRQTMRRLSSELERIPIADGNAPVPGRPFVPEKNEEDFPMD